MKNIFTSNIKVLLFCLIFIATIKSDLFCKSITSDYLELNPVVASISNTAYSISKINENLVVIGSHCADLFVPKDGDTITYNQNWLIARTSYKTDSVYRIDISKDKDFAIIDRTFDKLKVQNIQFAPNTRYFWRLNVFTKDSVCVSETWSFYTSSSTDIEYDNSISFIFPNPASDFITIQSINELNSDDIYNIQVFNTLGIEILEFKLTKDQISDLNRIDISQLPAGLYFIKFGSMIDKFVKF